MGGGFPNNSPNDDSGDLGETAIGYRIDAQKDHAENHFGVYVNPKKSNFITFSNEDFIIVLSED